MKIGLLGKHILFLTSTNLACNPRCLKEVRLCSAMGAVVSVVAFNLHNWTTEKEIQINKDLPGVKFYYLDATKNNLFRWLIASLIEKICRVLIWTFPKSLVLSSMCIGKRNLILLNWCKAIELKPDLIIAHNPTAFYPAYWLAKKKNLPFALDIEDFHPGEKVPLLEKKALTVLMSKLMPRAEYNSFASILIKKYSENLLMGELPNSNLIINNLFPSGEFLLTPGKNKTIGKLQLVWFSQYIDYGRGLEKILTYLDIKSDEIELTLIGNLRDNFFIAEIKNRTYVKCIAALSQKDLNMQLSNYDVGLAIEDAGEDLNRDICLTNKIWAYFQAGLYIIASATTSQKLFINSHQDHGIVSTLTSENFGKALQYLIANKSNLRASSEKRFKEASLINWETESKPLVYKWQSILS